MKYRIYCKIGDFHEITGFVGSPRDGNTKKFVEEALNAAESLGAETQLVHLGKMKIAPCKACDACRKTGKCTINDDFRKRLKCSNRRTG